MCKSETPLINSFIPEKTTKVTKWGVTQDCIIELGVTLSTFTTGVTKSGVAAELDNWIRIYTFNITTGVAESGAAAELYNQVRNYTFNMHFWWLSQGLLPAV